MKMKKIIKNWKTSLSGLAAAISGVVMFASGQKLEGITAILGALGLINAKDDDK